MLKRLSMVLAATAVMGICMAMVPQRVEAGDANLRFYGKHKHRWEGGNASADGQYVQKSRWFLTSWRKRYSVTLKGLYADTYKYEVKGDCGASKSGRVRVPHDTGNWKLEKNY